MEQIPDSLPAHQFVLERHDRKLSLLDANVSCDGDFLLHPDGRTDDSRTVWTLNVAPGGRTVMNAIAERV